jgi:glycosyltransferase involved in cell wall biosynthesis
VIPTYNGSLFIERALRSVFAQTRMPAEVVVVDDRSTDQTPEVVESLGRGAPTTVRLIRLGRNSGGPARPLNVGVKSAAGEVIVILEQDDTMRPRRIERQLAATLAHPGCSVVTGRFGIDGNSEGDLTPMWPVRQFHGVEDDVESKPNVFTLDARRAFRGLLRRQIGGSNSSLCFLKDSWNELGRFNEKVRACSDTEFMLKAALRGPIVVVNEIIMDYHWRADSLYRAQGERSFAETTLVRLRFAALRPDWAGEELPALQASARGMARSALHQWDWTLLAGVLPAVLLRSGVFGSLWAKARRRVLGRPVDIQGEGSSM